MINAIRRVQALLANKSKPSAERAEALMFLVHLVGDIHQPLHCANRNDAGASQFQVKFFGQSTNLHLVWDVFLIERRTFYWGEYARILESRVREQAAANASIGQPEDWAAVSTAYAIPQDNELADAYFQSALPVVERQMITAALRLARLLDQALGKAALPRPEYRRVRRTSKRGR